MARCSVCVASQVNTGAAEVLYSAVGEWAQLDRDSTVLDVCCGTGTIGISLAKVIFMLQMCMWLMKSLIVTDLLERSISLFYRRWKRWLGSRCARKQWKTPELMQSSTVERQNSSYIHHAQSEYKPWGLEYVPLSVSEGLSNVEFHCGKAEDVFPNILNAVVSPNITAIVDPPRAGLRKYTATTMWTVRFVA